MYTSIYFDQFIYGTFIQTRCSKTYRSPFYFFSFLHHYVVGQIYSVKGGHTNVIAWSFFKIDQSIRSLTFHTPPFTPFRSLRLITQLTCPCHLNSRRNLSWNFGFKHSGVLIGNVRTSRHPQVLSPSLKYQRMSI